jgi:serpin B
MTAGSVSAIISNLQTKSINLTMPKFNFDSSFSLNSALSALGTPIAFSNQADFSGMTGNKDLTIADVVHKAYVAVDEQGTEAAAATGVVMSAMAVMNQNNVTIDQPFIFMIRDIQTGAILFVGRVLNPAS